MEFSVFAQTLEELEGTEKRLEMTDALAELFRKADKDNINRLVYLLQGNVAPPYEGLEVGMGEKFVEEAIFKSTGYSRKEVEKEYKEMGDLGLVAEEFLKSKKQTTLASETLTVEKVFDTFLKISKLSGRGSQDQKILFLTELLNNAKPREGRYVVRFPLGRLRLGVGDPTILDALSVMRARDKSLRENLERAYNLCSDLGQVAKAFFEHGDVSKFEITVFKPIRPALAERLRSAEEIIEKIGKCAIEAKYDGFRCQVHKDGDRVEIFSRRLEKMTHMFPELVVAVRKHLKGKKAIVEGEALSYNSKTGKFYPFQVTIQRKRKYGVGKMAEEYPLKLFLFDIMYMDGKDLTLMRYEDRREELKKAVEPNEVIEVSEGIVTGDPKEIENYFDKYVSRGLEGIIAKDLNAPYVAGKRKFAWIKLKRSYKGELADTVDVTIVGYFKGRGARAKFGLGGLLGAVYEPETNTFKTITRIGTGFSDEQLRSFREKLDKISEPHRHARVDSLVKADVWVEPKYVITLTADEITKSPMHTCGMKEGAGYALRFPRLVGDIREDKNPEDSTSVEEIIEMYRMQMR